MSLVTTITTEAGPLPVTLVSGAVLLTPSGGTADHGGLTGLGDDDHPQYHNDARGDARYLASPALTGTPTAPTAAGGTNTTQLATTAFVRAEVASLVASAPGTLDTLDELAAALGDDANFAATVTAALAAKQPLDADLTAIAALSTTSYGRSLLTLADAAAARLEIARHVGTYTWADLQTAYPNGGAAFLALAQGTTAWVSGINADELVLMYRGATRWRVPDNTVIEIAPQDQVINTDTETALVQWLCPAGLLGVQAVIELEASLSDDGTTTGYTNRVRIGTVGDLTDPSVGPNITSGNMATTGRTAGVTVPIQLRTQTTANRRGSASTTGNAFMASGGTGTRSADTTISAASANALYWTLTSDANGTTDTVTVHSAMVRIITCGV